MDDIADELENLRAFQPIWSASCEVCGASPVVSATGLCGPCTWGEADTVAGGWWDAEDDVRLSALEQAAAAPTQGETSDE